MEFLGVKFEVKNTPELDSGFIPLYKFNKAFLSTAKKPVGIAIERADGEMASVDTFIHGTEEMRKADHIVMKEEDISTSQAGTAVMPPYAALL